MHFARSEALRLQAAIAWVERDLGKVVSMEGANIGQITFNVNTGVPEPDADPPRIPHVWKKTDE